MNPFTNCTTLEECINELLLPRRSIKTIPVADEEHLKHALQHIYRLGLRRGAELGIEAAAKEHTELADDFSDLSVKAMNRIAGLMPGMSDDFSRTATNHRHHANHIRNINPETVIQQEVKP